MDCDPMSSWVYEDKVCLLGDACHPMLVGVPFIFSLLEADAMNAHHSHTAHKVLR